MLRKNQLGLQVKVDGRWEWVFCQTPTKDILTTYDPRKALLASDHLGYFSNRYGDYEFRGCRAKDID
jgi:hypothetical protein